MIETNEFSCSAFALPCSASFIFFVIATQASSSGRFAASNMPSSSSLKYYDDAQTRGPWTGRDNANLIELVDLLLAITQQLIHDFVLTLPVLGLQTALG